MYAASVEGLSAEERDEFDRAMRPQPPRRRRALSAVPALPPERISDDRLAAIRSLGGDVTFETGA